MPDLRTNTAIEVQTTKIEKFQEEIKRLCTADLDKVFTLEDARKLVQRVDFRLSGAEVAKAVILPMLRHWDVFVDAQATMKIVGADGQERIRIVLLNGAVINPQTQQEVKGPALTEDALGLVVKVINHTRKNGGVFHHDTFDAFVPRALPKPPENAEEGDSLSLVVKQVREGGVGAGVLTDASGTEYVRNEGAVSLLKAAGREVLRKVPKVDAAVQEVKDLTYSASQKLFHGDFKISRKPVTKKRALAGAAMLGGAAFLYSVWPQAPKALNEPLTPSVTVPAEVKSASTGSASRVLGEYQGKPTIQEVIDGKNFVNAWYKSDNWLKISGSIKKILSKELDTGGLSISEKKVQVSESQIRIHSLGRKSDLILSQTNYLIVIDRKTKTMWVEKNGEKLGEISSVHYKEAMRVIKDSKGKK